MVDCELNEIAEGWLKLTRSFKPHQCQEWLAFRSTFEDEASSTSVSLHVLHHSLLSAPPEMGKATLVLKKTALVACSVPYCALRCPVDLSCSKPSGQHEQAGPQRL